VQVQLTIQKMILCRDKILFEQIPLYQHQPLRLQLYV